MSWWKEWLAGWLTDFYRTKRVLWACFIRKEIMPPSSLARSELNRPGPKNTIHNASFAGISQFRNTFSLDLGLYRLFFLSMFFPLEILWKLILKVMGMCVNLDLNVCLGFFPSLQPERPHPKWRVRLSRIWYECHIIYGEFMSDFIYIF